MNSIQVLRDAWYFFRNNLSAIARLCLPLIVLESLAQQLLSQAVGPDTQAPYSLLIGLIFYPIYTGALILFLDARSNGQAPAARDLIATSLRFWPQLALLTGLSTLAILLGASLFVLPGLWIMIKLAFAEYLLVLRGLTPLKALHESFEQTRGAFWQILTCVLCVMVPLWSLDLLIQGNEPGSNMLLNVAMDSGNGFLQLFASVVLFRLFMLNTPQPAED
ncbi:MULTISPECIES: YciC family protein [Pseudomonas]|uniref:YciC family protein n=1 Tax=Pseudomonas TaxID=286 RepID=UPI0008E1A6D4|nr:MULTISPECIES: YciC family protein [Pseudomonas]MBQ53773.1 hypothetical protein [Pseudomonadaceae bacterium]NRH28707.1 hypothetical protein [Pseudomonas sp. MS19]SFT55253.1 Uncharacterised protein family (UPF0259) [Pseudomonas marincola]HCP53380.1 hypothetical protein [Pseudomonas sp.]|tara:strand:+ start:155 stop:814 length:660 start_codon:yes stop_codon:yes gene_type:complete